VTDLDDTVWRGILGEVGADGVAWDLDHGAQHHGSTNRLRAPRRRDPRRRGARTNGLVDEAFARPISCCGRAPAGPRSIGRRNESLTRLLQRWNIGVDASPADDSAMELAEVKAAHPGVECLRLPPTIRRPYMHC
jgi:hypothetical protein